MNIGAHVEYIFIAEDSNQKVATVNFVPEALHPFNALKIIVEQILFIRFISLANTSSLDRSTFLAKLHTHFGNLPNEIHTGNSALDNIYRESYLWANSVFLGYDDVSHNTTVKALLNAPPVNKEQLTLDARDYYTGSITQSFIDEWFYLVYGEYDSDKYPDAEMPGAPLYLPSELFQKKGSYMCITKEQKDRSVVMLSPVPVCTTFYFTKQNELGADFSIGGYGQQNVVSYISQFNLRDYDIDHVIGFLAAFCIHEDQYDMTFSDSPTIGLPRICFDLVTGSSYVKDAGLKRSEVHSLDQFLNWVKTAVASGHLKPISDYDLFGNLLAMAGENSEIVNYFTKPVNSILATEAYAFRHSDYASLVEDRVFAGLEAAEDDADTDIIDSTEAEEDDADTDDADADSVENTDTNADLDDTDDDTLEDSSETAESDKAPIDPNKMLLELNVNDPNLKDYLLRDIIARRIASILKNPPENARPNDLLLLKRWQSRWLYLTSIACLKDFLMRLPIRLTDV